MTLMDMMSIRFLVTCFELVMAVIFYIVFLVKKDNAYGMCSVANLFLVSVTVLAINVQGIAWLWAY